jgi:hypothetical protein
VAGLGVGAGVGAGVGVGVATVVAVGDGREPPPTASGEEAAPEVPEPVSAHAAPDMAKTRQSAHTPAVRRSFMPPGTPPGKGLHIHALWSIVHRSGGQTRLQRVTASGSGGSGHQPLGRQRRRCPRPRTVFCARCQASSVCPATVSPMWRRQDQVGPLEHSTTDGSGTSIPCRALAYQDLVTSLGQGGTREVTDRHNSG